MDERINIIYSKLKNIIEESLFKIEDKSMGDDYHKEINLNVIINDNINVNFSQADIKTIGLTKLFTTIVVNNEEFEVDLSDGENNRIRRIVFDNKLNTDLLNFIVRVQKELGYVPMDYKASKYHTITSEL